MSDALSPFVEVHGYRFRAPFICVCCGELTDGEQFAYGRSCARCDAGYCYESGRTPSHDRPPWRGRGFDAYADAVGAEPLPETSARRVALALASD